MGAEAFSRGRAEGASPRLRSSAARSQIRPRLRLSAPQIFTEDLPEVEALPREKVLQFLKEGFEELAIPYLEHIVHVWEEQGPRFHNVLIQLYLWRVQSLMKQYLNSLPEGLFPARTGSWTSVFMVTDPLLPPPPRCRGSRAACGAGDGGSGRVQEQAAVLPGSVIQLRAHQPDQRLPV